MIQYTLFKPPVSKGDSEITQQIVRYVYKKFNKDIRPTNIIEREYPADINGKLPSILLWNDDDEEKQYIIGGQNVIKWYESIINVTNLTNAAIHWCQQNPNYRINDDHESSKNNGDDRADRDDRDDRNDRDNRGQYDRKDHGQYAEQYNVNVDDRQYDEQYDANVDDRQYDGKYDGKYDEKYDGEYNGRENYHDENEYEYDHDEEENKYKFSKECVFENDSEMKEIITFASINLWNDKTHRDTRFANFNQVMRNIEPDIICIQEITQPLLQKLFQQEWTKSYFKSTYKIVTNNNECGELILSKFPILKKETFPFHNTLTGQCVHISHIQIPLNYFQKKENEMEYTSFPVITTQLEKLRSYSDTRKEQLYSLFNMVSQLPTVFILSDTNLTDEDSDIITLPEGWNDTYEEHLINLNEFDMQTDNYNSAGESTSKEFAETHTFTFDSNYNKFIAGYQRYRFDRMFYKSNSFETGWKCMDFQLICNEELPISNHFGIFATFELR